MRKHSLIRLELRLLYLDSGRLEGLVGKIGTVELTGRTEDVPEAKSANPQTKTPTCTSWRFVLHCL